MKMKLTVATVVGYNCSSKVEHEGWATCELLHEDFDY